MTVNTAMRPHSFTIISPPYMFIGVRMGANKAKAAAPLIWVSRTGGGATGECAPIIRSGTTRAKRVSWHPNGRGDLAIGY